MRNTSKRAGVLMVAAAALGIASVQAGATQRRRQGGKAVSTLTSSVSEKVGFVAEQNAVAVRSKVERAKHRRRGYPLLTPLSGDRLKQVPQQDEMALRRRFVTADPARLFEPRRRGLDRRRRAQRRLTLQLFDDTRVDARLVALRRHRGGSFTWFGYVPGGGIGDVILTVVNGVMMGTINTGTEMYRLRELGPNVFELMELDVRGFPPEDGVDFRSGDLHDLSAAQTRPTGNDRRYQLQGIRNFRQLRDRFQNVEIADGVKVIADSGATIDVMIGYTREAAGFAASLVDENGSPVSNVTNIHVAIQHAVDRANLAVGASGVPTEIRLVHTVQVKDPEPHVNRDLLLEYLEPNDGHFDELNDLADQYRADITSLFVKGSDNFGGRCGQGKTLKHFVPPSEQRFINGRGLFSEKGRNVVKVRCATLYYSLMHEIGHNAGLKHDFFVHDRDRPGPTPYGHGFVVLGPRVRTVMAYRNLCHLVYGANEDCLIIPRFSDPTGTFEGWPLGVGPDNFYDEVDAVRAFTEALWTVANYRPSLLSP